MMRITLPLCLSLLLSLSACKEPEIPVVTTRPAQVWTVKPHEQSSSSTYSGEIKARYEADLSFRVGGKLITRQADIGDEVHPKQSLARLDTTDLNLNIASARANVAAVEADVANARAELNRVNELYRKQFIGRAAVDNAQAAYDAANARLSAARSQLKLSGNQAAYTELYTDKSGLITALSAEVGQVVGAGQPIMHIAYDGEREVHIRVGETAGLQLKPGQLVSVTLWAQAQQSLQGKIREISPSTDSTRSFLVKISLLTAPSDLRLGLTADVSIPNPTKADTSFIPSTALYQEGKQPAVWVVNDKHEVHLQPITIVSYQEDGINVTGLANGTQVIAAGVHKLNNGQVINPVPYDGKAGA